MSNIPFFNKNLPSWLKTVILFIISFICLILMSKYGLIEGNKHPLTGILLSNLVLVKLFFILGSLSSFIMIAYYAINIYLFIMFSRNNINVPIYLPQFILGWLKFIQQMSKYENKGFYIEFYFRLILVYLFILLLTLFTLSKLGVNTHTEIMYFTSNEPVSNNQDLLKDYPFILLNDLFTFNNLELVCLILIFNCFISSLIKYYNFDISTYLPDNRFRDKIISLFNLYVDLWYKSNVFVFTIAWTCLLLMNLATKYGLLIILTS